MVLWGLRGFPKMGGGTLFWCPYNDDYHLSVSMLGSPVLGNHHVDTILILH